MDVQKILPNEIAMRVIFTLIVDDYAWRIPSDLKKIKKYTDEIRCIVRPPMG